MTPKEYRKKTGQEQQEAAEDFGVAPSTWCRWEKKNFFPKPMLQLAKSKLKEKGLKQ